MCKLPWSICLLCLFSRRCNLLSLPRIICCNIIYASKELCMKGDDERLSCMHWLLSEIATNQSWYLTEKARTTRNQTVDFPPLSLFVSLCAFLYMRMYVCTYYLVICLALVWYPLACPSLAIFVFLLVYRWSVHTSAAWLLDYLTVGTYKNSGCIDVCIRLHVFMLVCMHALMCA